MTSILLTFLVTALIFGAAVAVGFRLARSPKPYPLGWLGFHIALFFVIAMAIGACMSAIESVLGSATMSPSITALSCAGPSLIALFISGIVMLFGKKKRRAWIMVHKVAMYLLALTLGTAGVLAVMGR
ncbi:hypothetical protein [Verrucomicrobium sp. BvORR106]|uniref:hypothetical protein n=1 Tax=Verrucomicrobium sp. BvORR106 TaxID=1403819 RepID=UPI000570CA91|nr:hypothetical protein [Verrucomicrobium sp. BvORR106]